MSAHQKTYVVKIGGAAIDQSDVADQLMRQVLACRAAGARIVLVHGGGDRLTQTAAKLGVEAPFVDGRRVTSEALIDVAKMVFAGGVGTDLAASAHRVGLSAISVSGVSGGLIRVKRRPPVNGVDYGLVGDVTGVNAAFVESLLSTGLTPLIASLGIDQHGVVYNVNADTIACRIACALKVAKLVILTGPDGVLRDLDHPESRVESLKASDILEHKLDFSISGGMLPKLASLAAATLNGVQSVQLASWRHTDVLERCLIGQCTSVGTRIDGPGTF